MAPSNYLVMLRHDLFLFAEQISMSGSSVRHQQAIDQQLKNEYHQVCFNPAKRDVFYRLTAPPTQEHSQGQFSNAMLHQYMQAIYEHYGIEDPIKREFRLAKRSLEIPSKPSPEKSLNQTQVSESDRLTRTKRRLISLKDSFKQDSSEVVYTSQLQQGSMRESTSPFNRSRLSRQIGYRTKEKMHFKTLPRDEPIRQTSRPTVRHQPVIEKKGQPKVVVRFNNKSENPEQSAGNTAKEVPVVFRYCPMCEVSVLDCNTNHHESVCGDFQKAYSLPYCELQSIIKSKIHRMEEEISSEFLRRDEMKVANQFSDLKQSVTLWMQQPERSSQSLQNVKHQFHNFACDTYEKINKLSWFKRLLRTVSSKRSLEAALRPPS